MFVDVVQFVWWVESICVFVSLLTDWTQASRSIRLVARAHTALSSYHFGFSLYFCEHVATINANNFFHREETELATKWLWLSFYWLHIWNENKCVIGICKSASSFLIHFIAIGNSNEVFFISISISKHVNRHWFVVLFLLLLLFARWARQMLILAIHLLYSDSLLTTKI